MLADLAFAALSMIVLLAGVAMHPARAACPRAWHVEAVRPGGSYLCRRNPPPAIDRVNPRGGWYDASPDEPTPELGGNVYCTGGTRAVVVSDRVVGCSR